MRNDAKRKTDLGTHLISTLGDPMTDLLPCPFCGQTPNIGPFASAITIHCANDDCDVGVETSATTETVAVEQWNKRKPASCPRCNDSRIEFVDGGNGNVLEQPCSMCCDNP